MSQQEFKLGDVLSVTTLFCLTTMPRVISLLEFMTGENRGSDMWTEYFASRCAESLFQQLPRLADVVIPDEFEDEAHVDRWLTEQEAIYGKTLTVRMLADTGAASR